MTTRRAASFGNERHRQLQCAGDVGVIGFHPGLGRAGDLNVFIVGSPFRGSIAAEHHDAGVILPIVVAMFFDFRIHIIGHRAALFFWDADRLIQQIDDRQLLAGAHHLNFSQGENDQQHHQRSQRQNKPAPNGPQRLQRANAKPPQRRQHQQQQQPARRIESNVEACGKFEVRKSMFE